MPEGIALATTKRKFYKALDSLTTSSQVSLAPSATESTTAAKRPATAVAAFDEARERAAKRLRHSTSSSSLPQRVIPPTGTTKKNAPKSNDPPNFSPWSHEAFLARLKTFSSVSLWHPKPDAINEVEWAKRGWVCVDVNTVGCRGGCEKRVLVSLDTPKKQPTESQDEDESDDEDDDAAFEQALANRYKDAIVGGHGVNCLWRKEGCKDDIYRLQVVRPSVWQPEVRKRYQSLLNVSSSIQNLKLKGTESHDVKSLTPERLLKDLPSDIVEGGESIPDSHTRAKALEVALHGWRGSKESGSELLHCDACFQRVGLWMYQPDYRPAHSDSDDERLEDASVLNLVELHRDHCPWRNPATQKATGSLKGLNACEILLRVVSTYARDYRRRSDEQTPAVNGDAEVEASDTLKEDAPVHSREEVARQDKERESRIRKLKSMFTIKRRSKNVSKP